MFGTKEGPGGLPTFGSPHHDTWNRLRRTPPSFPTPPQWPKTADAERSSSANSHEREREREREREKRDSSIGKEEKDKDRWVKHTFGCMFLCVAHIQYVKTDS